MTSFTTAASRRTLITSALPYINGIKHLGNLAGSMLPADVHARFRRLRDGADKVLFICATDEHGTPAELGAAEAGMDVRAYCDEQHEIQKKIYENLDLSFDHFGRSSSQQNHRITQELCDALEENGFIEERTTKQVYSIDDGRFLPDRYVEGTCPICAFPDARGDQCDNCGTLLDPTELINPRSKISGSHNIEVRDTAHLFLKLDALQDRVRAWVDTHDNWPHLTKSIALKWLNEGLNARSITRDLSWGIPVLKNGKPRPGFEGKVFYVWFDAPIEYIAATEEWADANGKGNDWKSWWRTDAGADNVTYLEFMGKDNVAFHTVNFPATILGSGQPWKLVDQLKSFNWLNWYGGKFSTSRKRGVFLDQALDILPTDYWRWYLMANASEGSDTNFTWEQFQTTCNSDLANILGNFVNRIVKFTHSKLEGKVPDAPIADIPTLAPLLAELTAHHEAMEFRKAAATTRAIWVAANEYITEAAPWTAIKTDQQEAAIGVRTGLELCVLLARIAAPFIPGSADKIAGIFGLKTGDMGWVDAQSPLGTLTPGAAIGDLPPLFARIEDDWVAEQKVRFGGDPAKNEAA